MQAMAVITFAYSCSQEVLSELAMDFAKNVRPTIEGLIWKIYLNDPENRRSARLYLFRDVQSANAYVSSSYIKGLRQAPIVSDVSTEVFQTMKEVSIQSGAPMI